MNKEKLKEFARKHEHKIKIAANVIVAAAVGGAVGYVSYRTGMKHVYQNEFVVNKDEHSVLRVLTDIDMVYGDSRVMVDGINQYSTKVADFGKLGEIMINGGIPADLELTHFIMCGPKYNG